MSTSLIARLRHPKESTYGGIMVVVAIILWVIIALALAGAMVKHPAAAIGYCFDIIIFTVFILISAALFRAHILGHYVLLGPTQFPDLHRMVAEGAEKIGLSPVPSAFIYNSNGAVNAYARRLLGGRYIFLTSALVEVQTDAQVRFVIGHELGHHAAGHLDPGKSLLKLPASFVPFLAQAYHRGRELTCDRAGAYLSADSQACRSALNMLACGCGRLNAKLNCDAFEAQETMVPALAGWVTLVFARYPRTTQRVRAISEYFAQARAQI